MSWDHCSCGVIGPRWIAEALRIARALSAVTDRLASRCKTGPDFLSLTPAFSHAFAPINISIQITGDRRVPGSNP